MCACVFVGRMHVCMCCSDLQSLLPTSLVPRLSPHPDQKSFLRTREKLGLGLPMKKILRGVRAEPRDDVNSQLL